MTLLLTMLPFYFLGNLHCMGMCGPLVLMLGQHRYRCYYFFGRTLSFTLAGMLAGEVGAVIHLILQKYHIPALASFLFGGAILAIGVCSLIGVSYPSFPWLSRRLSKVSQMFTFLMLRDHPWTTFLFGFFTIALPCGQTIIVYSACALSGDLYVGMLNGFVFALLTSPSLYFSMHAHTLLHRMKRHYNKIIGWCGVFVGGIAICRGLAEVNILSHLILNPNSPAEYHLVLF